MEGTNNMTNNTTELFSANSFMKEVQTYMEYKIADFLAVYWFPILIPIALVGNTLSFLVMIKPNNRKMSTCIYMAAISINDNFMILLVLYNWIGIGMKLYDPNPLECELVVYWVFIAMQNSTYQVIAMTIDKYIAIKWPHKAAIYSTPKRAKVTVIGVTLSIFIYNIPHFFITKMVGGVCIGYVAGGMFTIVYSWMSFIVNGLVPFTLLIYMNYVIVKKVRISRKMFEDHEGQGKLKGESQNNAANTKRQQTMKNTENQLTIMLLLVTILFLILMIPTYIRYIYTQFIKTDTPAKYASFALFFQISQKLYNTNNGINFFLYCISGQKFRNDLKEILCCGRKGENHTRSNTMSNITEMFNVPDLSVATNSSHLR